MERTYNPTFKPPSASAPPRGRQSTPDPPAIEPLSPLQHQETPFTSFLSSYVKQNVRSGNSRSSQAKQSRARKISQETAQSSPNEHKRKSSNTIDELAQVALLVGEPGASQTRNPTYPIVNAYHQHPVANGYQWASPPAPVTPFTRPAKRARSEAEAVAHQHPAHTYAQYSRPATSTVSQQQTTRPPASNDYEAAALLLGFASHAPASAASASYGYHRTPSLPVPPQLQHHWTNAVAPVPAPVPAAPPAPADPTYLPSPQPTTEESHPSSKEQSDREARVSEDPMVDVTTAEGRNPQIHTPPEDELPTTAQPEEQGTPAELATQSEGTPADTEEAKPKRKGWPKGKPRGPRKSTTAAASKLKTTTAKRGRKSAATKAAEEAPIPRRKSFSEYNLPHDTLDLDRSSRAGSVPPSCQYVPGKPKSTVGKKALPKLTKDTVCEACNTTRESAFGEVDTWLSCNGCKKWYHCDCAGFKSDKDVRDVDKFFCPACEPEHGPTTFVRKSTRAHTAVDYAGLNQGVLKTSDDCKEHHYIQSIKDGTFRFDPETFPRMRPELVTAEYFERSSCFNQPVLIPAEFNPKPGSRNIQEAEEDVNMNLDGATDTPGQLQDDLLQDYEYETVPDDGQDKLDMVIPQDLTVRKVCELVGADYPLDVIDTKAQGTENRMWNLGRWADYYEQEGEKDIRNVISLEVSATKLGRLLRRPKVVRQIDLQDNVWPADEPAKSVAFYCLMSAADSYTDFHIDFGGSSVYYHILRGSKTFFFIPPKAKHLKAYEDWNNSPQQNFTFLPNITKECYRVDLFEGDTMLIPSGWIHAVWTPSNSLVIGGNFLTHMHYSMQFRVVDVEKANKTPQKFRYPKFQKVMWYAVLRYLREDPLPQNVRDTFYDGERFQRDVPTWAEFDLVGNNAEKGSDNYNARYYSQMELDGLTDLVSFIFRTVMISQDRIEGVTVESRKAVIASIPKSHGEPLELAKTFALWVAWKRGNEDPPAWAHPDAGLPEKESNNEPKKLSAKMLKQMQRHEAFEAWKLAPGRQSMRQKEAEAAKAREIEEQETKAPTPSPVTTTPKTSGLGPKRIACDACRRRRIRCKHKEEIAAGTTPGTSSRTPGSGDRRGSREFDSIVIPKMSKSVAAGIPPAANTPGNQSLLMANTGSGHPITPMHGSSDTISVAPMSAPQFTTPGMPSLQSQPSTGDASAKRGRSKACADCRKSKRRCVHDENGQIDPVKEKQAPIPRSNATKKRKSTDGQSPEIKRPKKEPKDAQSMNQVFAGPSYSSGFDDMQTTIQVAPARYGGRHVTDDTDHNMAIDPQLADIAPHALPEDQSGLSNTNPIHSTTSFEQFAAQALQQSNMADVLDPSLMSEDTAGDEQPPKHEVLATAHETGSTDSGVVMADDHASGLTEGPSHSHQDMPSGSGLASSSGPDTIMTDVPLGQNEQISSELEVEKSTTEQVSAMPGFTGEQATPIANSAKASGSADRPIVDMYEAPAAVNAHPELPAATTTDATIPSVEQAHTSRPQTPAANDPPSLSSASTPLSSAHGTPEPLEAPVMPTMEAAPVRQSSRSAKPVERFSNGTYAGSLLTQPSASPGKAKSATPSHAVNGRKRGSSSLTPGPMNHSGNGADAAILGKVVAVPREEGGEKDRSRTPATAEPLTEEQRREEESVRLARELAGESFGLRQRRGLT
ncbi:JmjC domain-containing protein 1 [Elsinoe australis]|uniref:JmjC domain-containing histone demethylation protein 1 n=1 Tax=Elsinoe australis TaxID=40998 RepID=A0A4U7BFS2_9PEZI|nr:JmjC domain-containing protein 1 [Elsinoe australis]